MLRDPGQFPDRQQNCACSSPDPNAGPGKDADYFVYWARITGAGSGNLTVAAAATTQAPLYHGKDTLGFAEFEMVRLDHEGRIRYGASVPSGDGNDQHWQAVYGAQAEGPAT